MSSNTFYLMVFVSLVAKSEQSFQVDFKVNCSSVVSRLPHFWESTGLCPPLPHQEADKYLLSRDMHQNLALIGSLPGQAYKQLRVHWLLNLVSVFYQNGETMFNYTNLDLFMRLLNENRLKPGFELMGNPSNIFSDFENSTQLFLFKRLVTELSSRYASMFGINVVKQWNFENWNEPDNKDFDGLNFTLSSFNNYFDACFSGLKETSSELNLGGISERCIPMRKQSFCYSLLNHVANGINYFTGKKNDTKLDFIALHEKGIENDVDIIITKEKKVIKEIHKHFPQFKNKEVMNEECDPIVRWSTPYVWNGDSIYASIAAEIIIKHIRHYLAKRNSVKFTLLSNDNAFLSYHPFQFEQRTLLARFQINNTNPKTVQFIRKPIYTALGLFDLLGDKLLFTAIENNSNISISALATSEQGKEEHIFASLISASPYKRRTTNDSFEVKIQMDFTGFEMNGNWRWRRFIVNNEETNPYEIWESDGKPAFPSNQLLQKMRYKEGPAASDIHDLQLKNNIWIHSFDGNAPEVSLFIICTKRNNFTNAIKNFRAIRVSRVDVLFVWSPVRNKCLRSYYIEHSDARHGNFTLISKVEIIYPSFHYMNEENNLTGYYKVYAEDFWNRKSQYSAVVYLR